MRSRIYKHLIVLCDCVFTGGALVTATVPTSLVGRSGRVLGLTVRAPSGTKATGATSIVYIETHTDSGSRASASQVYAASTVPADEFIALSVTGITWTGSATAATVQSAPSAPLPFSNGLAIKFNFPSSSGSATDTFAVGLFVELDP